MHVNWMENSVDLDSGIYLPKVWSVHHLSSVFGWDVAVLFKTSAGKKSSYTLTTMKVKESSGKG